MRALAPLLLLLCLAAAAPGQASAQDAPAAPSLAADERPLLTPRRVGSLKAGIALAGAALLAWTAWSHRQPEPRRHRQLQDALLLGLGLAAGLGWWNFSAFNHPGFGHPSDTFHYYVGSKYFPELGYQRLYLCTAVADVEAGLRSQVEARSLRDLASNQLVSAAIAIEHPETCTARFSPERWAAFARDIGWFRSHVPARRWQAMQTDHGYNATPLWTALGGGLANRVPASDASILALRLIDPLLLAAMWLGGHARLRLARRLRRRALLGHQLPRSIRLDGRQLPAPGLARRRACSRSVRCGAGGRRRPARCSRSRPGCGSFRSSSWRRSA